MLKKIRLAVIFDQQICVGGGYQQALNAALLAKQLSGDLVELVFFTPFSENVDAMARVGISVIYLRYNFLLQFIDYLRAEVISSRLLKLLDWFGGSSPLDQIFAEHRIDLVYFLSPNGWAARLEKTNYVTTVWDLCHRDHPEFPEVRSNRELKSRDINYRSILPGAVGIIVDSEISKRNIQCR